MTGRLFLIFSDFLSLLWIPGEPIRHRFFAPFLLCLCLIMLLSTWALKHILCQHNV